MTKSFEAVLAQGNLPTAGWDLTTFLESAKSQIQTWGGALLMLVGVAALVWGGIQLIKKVWGNSQHGQEKSWSSIALLVLIGGALSTGGWNLMQTVGSGGQRTIEDLGGGTVILGVNNLLTSGTLSVLGF